jgi:hypothetical protein
MKNLQSFGVHELNIKEIRETDGGYYPGIGLALLAYFVYETLSNPVSSGQAFANGLEAGEGFWEDVYNLMN